MNCALCENESELKLSHIIPKFVFRHFKKDTFTGRFRNATNPNRPLQDGDKMQLLCGDCEELFSANETHFTNNVFLPFKENGFNSPLEFNGDWLNKFVSSVNWRNLYLDIEGFEEDQENELDEKKLMILKRAETIMRDYLLNKRIDLGGIQNHIFFFDGIKEVNGEIENPHSLIQGTVFGYTVLNKDGGIYVISNLTGVLIITIIKMSPKERWKNTYIKNGAGKIRLPQSSNSPVFSEIMYIQKKRKEYLDKLSEKQKKQISDKISNNLDGFKESGSYKRLLLDQALKKEQNKIN